MGEPVQTFWVGDSGVVELSLRRYRLHDEPSCPVGPIHHASVPIGGAPAHRDRRGYLLPINLGPFLDDDRWPTRCDCGYEFTPEDERTIDQETIYVRPEGTERWAKTLLPVGAMYDAFWMPQHYRGQDGIGLVVVVPEQHHWHPDVRAHNCSRVGDDPDFVLHKCWVRHGDPRAPRSEMTVDKDGPTCTAGAGSVVTEEWHGFLQAGMLVG